MAGKDSPRRRAGGQTGAGNVSSDVRLQGLRAVTPLRVAADAAWAEVESLRQEVLHALTLDDTSPACRAHTDEAYAAYRRAQERAVAIEQLAEHSEGGYNAWAGAS